MQLKLNKNYCTGRPKGRPIFLFPEVFTSKAKPGAARRVQLFEFKGLGSSPNQQKRHSVNTNAQLATTIPVRNKEEWNEIYVLKRTSFISISIGKIYLSHRTNCKN